MLSRRDALKLMGAVGLGTMGFRSRGNSTGGGNPSPPYQKIWGLGGSYYSESRLATIYPLVAAMGCTWIKDSLNWTDFHTAAGTLHGARLAQLKNSITLSKASGLRQFMVISVNAPSWATGGGGGAYPTNAANFATYKSEFTEFLTLLLTECDLDAITVGAEMSGPDYWLPDGVLGNKSVANRTAFCAAYRSLYADASAAAKAVRPKVIVASSGGDSDFGYVNGWATEQAAGGFRPEVYCIYDYRYTGAHPYTWGNPEDKTVGDVQGRADVNLRYYKDLLRVPICITETGWIISGTRKGSTISQAEQASLMCRTAALAASEKPWGVFHHTLVDVAGSEAGVLNDDLSVRPAYTALATVLNYMPPVQHIKQDGADWRACNAQVGQVATWNTGDDSFSFDYAGKTASVTV